MRKKILLIDDSDDDLELMAMCLEEAGFKDIIKAQNGETGIKAAKEQKPDLVVTDTNLGDIDGFEVCRRVSQNGNTPAPKLIIITGNIDAVDALKAKSVGAEDYVVKTTDYAMLIEALNEIFKS